MMIESGVPLNKHNTCPICGNGGVAVKKIIVDHLVVDEFKKSVSEEGYRICMNEGCDIVYYNNNKGIRFTQDQVCVPIWFKKDADPVYACYCSKVTEKQVMDAVDIQGAKTVEEVMRFTSIEKKEATMLPELKMIKIGAPALRALEEVGIHTLLQLCEYSEKEILDLHGVGPKAVRVLKELLDKEGLSFKM